MQNERNMKCCRSTWNQQNNSSIHFRACLGMSFGFMLDLEYTDFHKTLDSDRAPRKSDNNSDNSNHSDVKDFDGSSFDSICSFLLHLMIKFDYNRLYISLVSFLLNLPTEWHNGDVTTGSAMDGLNGGLDGFRCVRIKYGLEVPGTFIINKIYLDGMCVSYMIYKLSIWWCGARGLLPCFGAFQVILSFFPSPTTYNVPGVPSVQPNAVQRARFLFSVARGRHEIVKV